MKATADARTATRQLEAGTNCAADGTGANRIDSFLEPRPRDFTSPDFNLINTPGPLRELIKGGIENSSMPAWRSVLTDAEIDDIIQYMQAAFAAD